MNLKERTVKIEDRNIDLTRREYDIVELTASRGTGLFKRADYEKVWGYDSEGDSVTVVERIKNIRAKFAAVTPDTDYILTVWESVTNGIKREKAGMII